MTVFTSACCRSAERSGASGQTVATTLQGQKHRQMIIATICCLREAVRMRRAAEAR